MYKPFNMENPIIVKHLDAGDVIIHGDVILFAEESLPKEFSTFNRLEDNTLALGESTFHLHKLFGDNIDLRENPDTKVKYLKLVVPAMLRHQEHRQITLPPGNYRIGIQREYDPFSKRIRAVVD